MNIWIIYINGMGFLSEKEDINPSYVKIISTFMMSVHHNACSKNESFTQFPENDNKDNAISK